MRDRHDAHSVVRRNSAAVLVVLAIGCGGAPATGTTGDSSSSSPADDPTITPTTKATADTSGAPPTSADTSATGEDASSTDSGTDTDTAGATPCDEYDAFASELARVEPGERIALLEGFVAQMQYSEQGLPIRCDARLVVMLWDESGGALSVTGDFADWDAAAHPLSRIVDDLPLWVGDVALDEPLVPGMYKLVRDRTEYFADPWARRFGWDEFGEYSLTAARDGTSHHERYPGFAGGVGDLQPRDVVVYVPAGALASDRELGVIYMHDGQNLFAPDASFGGWQVTAAMDDAIAAGDIPPMFVVAVDNTSDRFDEYTHTTDDPGVGPTGGRADEYADFVVYGVKAFVDDRYPTASDAASTAVLGSSLGGLVSLYLAWRHPDVFGHAGSMSGTLDWGTIAASNDRILELYEQQPPDGVWVYLDSGGAGPCPGGSDNYCTNVEMRDRLVDLGWTKSESLVYLHAPGAMHDEAAWASRLPGFLAALGTAMSI